MTPFFERNIEFLKGVGPQRAELLQKELKIFTFGDLLEHFPFRYEDRTKFYKVREVEDGLPFVQIVGQFKSFQQVGTGSKQRLVGIFSDETGSIEIVWFQGAKWILDKIKTGVDYVVFGKPSQYGSSLNIAHPEIELVTERSLQKQYLQPVYPTTEKLKKKFIESKHLSGFMKQLLVEAVNHLDETLPAELLSRYKLVDRKTAYVHIHFPKNPKTLEQAKNRLKFEELFFLQLRLISLKLSRKAHFPGIRFTKSDLLNHYYEHHLPFSLTNAQKRVIKEIYQDFRSGKQMNRLVQGDVGSGKTMVAFLCMLIAISNGYQCSFMAPTEILADQHFKGLSEYAAMLNVEIGKWTGSTKKSGRKELSEKLQSGELKILVGTHALIEDQVQFQKLGLAIIDEQHRFGVAQRARLWQKDATSFPHVLVMTATPIPRTLAMTLYGDLDISAIDEMPAGRKPIKTTHMKDSQRLKLFQFIEDSIKAGGQVYIVYPLIEESEKLDYKDLMDGYESISRRFPQFPISIVHGRMKAEDKDFEMKRFVKNETKIMVATTVIEVGVNVPNASVMVIENAERFGLSQLHQLRGRVGRGGAQSYCVLMTGIKLSSEAKARIHTMVETTDGFKIAEMDLKLRGPGDLMGTQQSGITDLKISDIALDQPILIAARNAAEHILTEDPALQSAKNKVIRNHLKSSPKYRANWSHVS